MMPNQSSANIYKSSDEQKKKPYFQIKFEGKSYSLLSPIMRLKFDQSHMNLEKKSIVIRNKRERRSVLEMSKNKQVNRLIVTDKGLEISKDIKREIEQNHNSNNNQWDDYSPKKNRRGGINPANPNLPSGYQASLQARMSVQIMNRPVKSSFLANSRYNSPTVNPVSSHNFSTHFGIGFTPNNDILLSPFNNFNNHYSEGQPRSSLLAKSHETLNPISNSSNKLPLSTAFLAVNNKKALQNLVSVESLGGLKLPLNNFNYQKELNNQNEMQKQQIQQVQQERLAKKYNEWNEKYLKSNELMKTKYYQKYEDISKLGDKEDEENFWKQWHQVKQSFDQCLQDASEQNQRYEERLIRKLNNKYRNSFKTLPTVAKMKKLGSTQNFPKIEKKNN